MINYFELDKACEYLPQVSNIRNLLQYCFQHYNNKLFLCDKGVEYSYCDIEQRISVFTKYIALTASRQKAPIAILACDGIDYIVGSLSVLNLGYPCMVIPVDSSKQDIENIIQKYNIQMILYDSTIDPNMLYNIYQRIGYLKSFLFPISIYSIITLPVTLSQSYQDITDDDTAVIMFTSGTEDKMRGVELSHRNIICGMYNGLRGLYHMGYNEYNQRYQLTIPLTHTFGFIRNLMCCMLTGSSLIISKNLKSVISDIVTYKPTRLVTVPGLLDTIISMNKQGIIDNTWAQSLQYIITGGATVSAHIIDYFQNINIPIYVGYGMTETANLCTGNPGPWSMQWSSIGFLYPDIEYKLIDNELYVKGPNVFKGYYQEDNTNTFDTEGFFATGDLVTINEDNMFVFMGRKKHLIVLDNGINISPNYLEQFFINNTNFIQECRIYSPNNKNVLCEYYTTEPPQDTTILDNLNATLGPQKITYFIYNNMPLPKTKKMEVKR